MGLNPDMKIMQTTHTAELSARFGRKVRNLMDTDEYKQKMREIRSKLRYEKVCIICSSEFIAKHKKAKYCSSKCVTKSGAEYHRKYYLTHNHFA